MVVVSARLIIGLGNPGMDGTRHNLGRRVVQELADKQGAIFRFEKSFTALVAPIVVNTRKVYLVLPETYMNNSGQTVFRMCQYYQIRSEETVVAVDDMAFTIGQLKLQPSGGAGGHNGLADIERLIGKNYPRLRLGIGKAPFSFEAHVLGRFNAEEERILPIEKAVEALQRLTIEDFARVATDLNKRN